MILLCILVILLCSLYVITYYFDSLFYMIHETKLWKIYHDIKRYKSKLNIKERGSYPNGDNFFIITIKDIPLYTNLKIHYNFVNKDIFIIGGGIDMVHMPEYMKKKLSEIIDSFLFKSVALKSYHY